MKIKPTVIISLLTLFIVVVIGFLIRINFDLKNIKQENSQLKKQIKETTLSQHNSIVDLLDRINNLEQNYQNQSGNLSETSENVFDLQNQIQEQNDKLNDYKNCKKFWSSNDPSYCDRIYSF